MYVRHMIRSFHLTTWVVLRTAMQLSLVRRRTSATVLPSCESRYKPTVGKYNTDRQNPFSQCLAAAVNPLV
jgi:hypothetical protein